MCFDAVKDPRSLSPLSLSNMCHVTDVAFEQRARVIPGPLKKCSNLYKLSRTQIFLSGVDLKKSILLSPRSNMECF